MILELKNGHSMLKDQGEFGAAFYGANESYLNQLVMFLLVMYTGG
jgi:hypothetical protein